jgi:hypothetical protein
MIKALDKFIIRNAGGTFIFGANQVMSTLVDLKKQSDFGYTFHPRRKSEPYMWAIT